MIIFLLIFLMMQLIHILKKWRSVFHYSLVVWSVFRNWRVLGLCLSHHLPWLGLILPSARYVTSVVSDIQSTLKVIWAQEIVRGGIEVLRYRGIERIGRVGEQKRTILWFVTKASAEAGNWQGRRSKSKSKLRLVAVFGLIPPPPPPPPTHINST